MNIGEHRNHPRTSDTTDLKALMRAGRQTRAAGPVLNLSEGGMLVGDSALEQGEPIIFELSGPAFRYSGLATVSHSTDGAVGLRFLGWHGVAGRPLRALIANRLPRTPRITSSTATPPRGPHHTAGGSMTTAGGAGRSLSAS